MTNRISRLAPSPTGALHLGNARTFLINWSLARNDGWRLILRIEDLEGPRIKADAAREAIEILGWLGLDHDGEILYQSVDLDPYCAAMHALARAGLIYPCRLTRKEIEQAASAPHGGEHELRYPAEFRPPADEPSPFDDEQMNYRLRVPDESICVRDQFAGLVELHPFNEVGDFVVWTRRGAPAYQLAVVVDDARQGVTDVVRGADLLPSAARQELLYRALNWSPPRWTHLPLVLGPDGKRLAKRHGDTRLSAYRAAGISAERVIGLIASWSGVCAEPEPMSADDFRGAFALANLPSSPVTFTERDHAWLLEQ